MSPTPPAIFQVPDMTCAHCESALRAALGAALPTAHVAIDLAAHTVTVAGAAGPAEAAIRDAGYTPRLLAG